YLAETGFDSQMTNEPRVEHADDLFQPVPGDHGAHGDFDDRAIERSWDWELNKRRGLLAVGGILAGLCCWGLARQSARNNGDWHNGDWHNGADRRFGGVRFQSSYRNA
ncbi:MAG: hypothetical protein ACTHK7_22545, partial [Aureliella sp.]